MLGHLHHEFWALQFGMTTGPIFNFCSGGELAAYLNACNQRWLQVCTGGVQGCRVTGRPGADNDEAVMLRVAHKVVSENAGGIITYP
jgi:hypothetical protein